MAALPLLSDHSFICTAIESGYPIHHNISTYLRKFRSVSQNTSWMTTHLTISLNANLSFTWCSFCVNNIPLNHRLSSSIRLIFNLKDYIEFPGIVTRSSTSLKLKLPFAKSISKSSRHFYFLQLPISRTHSHLSTLILHLCQSDPPFVSSSVPTLIPPNSVLITTSSVHAVNA